MTNEIGNANKRKFRKLTRIPGYVSSKNPFKITFGVVPTNEPKPPIDAEYEHANKNPVFEININFMICLNMI